jgi:hypothetical protein
MISLLVATMTPVILDEDPHPRTFMVQWQQG